MRNQIEFEVYGKYGLFTDPVTRIGGEKFTYQIPTYEALKGIVKSIYWKPSLIWVVDEVRVISPIQTEVKSMRPMKYQSPSNELAYYTYLRAPRYQVRAHFEFNPHRPDLKDDWNEHKHHNIAKRALERGGRRDIFLGTRECQGYVEPCTFGQGEGFYDQYGELAFSPMFHGFSYPDENGKGVLEARIWTPTMKDGIISFVRPEQCSIVRNVKDYDFKSFDLNANMKHVTHEFQAVFGEEEVK